MKVLFIDCCMKQGEESRTKVLCNEFIRALKDWHKDYEISEIVLKDIDIKPYDMELVEERYTAIKENDLTNPLLKYAHQFAEADRIIIGAPYWDLAFPSLLKIYIENIFVEKITFDSTERGLVGLSKGEKAMYIQTAGGFVADDDPGMEYLEHVLKVLGIESFQRVGADGIDIMGIDVEEKLNEAKLRLREVAKEW